jgi:hypothetical protein
MDELCHLDPRNKLFFGEFVKLAELAELARLKKPKAGGQPAKNEDGLDIYDFKLMKMHLCLSKANANANANANAKTNAKTNAKANAKANAKVMPWINNDTDFPLNLLNSQEPDIEPPVKCSTVPKKVTLEYVNDKNILDIFDPNVLYSVFCKAADDPKTFENLRMTSKVVNGILTDNEIRPTPTLKYLLEKIYHIKFDRMFKGKTCYDTTEIEFIVTLKDESRAIVLWAQRWKGPSEFQIWKISVDSDKDSDKDKDSDSDSESDSDNNESYTLIDKTETSDDESSIDSAATGYNTDEYDDDNAGKTKRKEDANAMKIKRKEDKYQALLKHPFLENQIKNITFLLGRTYMATPIIDNAPIAKMFLDFRNKLGIVDVHQEKTPATSGGGRQPKMTTDKVIISGRTRNVYVGPRGGKTIKLNGKWELLSSIKGKYKYKYNSSQ